MGDQFLFAGLFVRPDQWLDLWAGCVAVGDDSPSTIVRCVTRSSGTHLGSEGSTSICQKEEEKTPFVWFTHSIFIPSFFSSLPQDPGYSLPSVSVESGAGSGTSGLQVSGQSFREVIRVFSRCKSRCPGFYTALVSEEDG